MANQGGILKILNQADGTAINALASQDATFETQAYAIGEMAEFGIIIDWVEDAGTGGFTVTVEMSPDNGTTWWSMPAALNSETAAGMTEVTATGKSAEFWANPLPNNSNARIRFVFTESTAAADYTITAYLVAHKVKRATDG